MRKRTPQNCSRRITAPTLHDHRGVRRPFILALIALLPLAGCGGEPIFLRDGPDFRGITVPLPPPSFVDDPLVDVDLEGQFGPGRGGPGSRVYVQETVTELGYFIDIVDDDPEFVVPDVTVDVTNNCLRTWYVDGQDAVESTDRFYRVTVETDPELCAAETCSATDDVGACLCLDVRNSGC